MGGRVRVEHEYGAGNAGGGLFEHLKPLPHHLEIDEHEASDVPAGMRQARNEALLDGIVDRRHNDRNGACRLPQGPDDWRRLADDYVRRERHEFCCVGSYAADIAPTKACLDLDVVAVCPAQLLQALLQRCHSGLSFPIVGHSHQQPDAPHPLALLRARRERPRGSRAAECGQQFPPSDGDCHTPLPCEVRRERYHATRVQSLRLRRGRSWLLPPQSPALTALLLPPGSLANAAIAASRVGVARASVLPPVPISFLGFCSPLAAEAPPVLCSQSR